MTSFCLIDPDAKPAENIGAVLAYREECVRADAFERQQATATCERHRAKITRGNPPFGVLHAIERGVAPTWVERTLRDRFASAGTAALAAA